MGAIKEHIHELWSQIEADVSFQCPYCGHPASETLKFSMDEGETYEEASCLNDEDEHVSTVIIRWDDLQGYTAELAEWADVDVSIKVYDPWEDWDEPEPELDAYGIFQEAMREWYSNVLAISEPHGHSSRNRMLFGTLYSIAEAYFYDRIIGSALTDLVVQKEILKIKELGLSDKKLSLSTVLDNPSIVKDMIRTSLQGLSYHNLQLVNSISLSAYGKPILPSDKLERDIALASVLKRHDCVHRNGVRKDGTKHVDITPDYLKLLGGIMEGMADSLESAIRTRFFKPEAPAAGSAVHV